jgi:hypothetical protein
VLIVLLASALLAGVAPASDAPAPPAAESSDRVRLRSDDYTNALLGVQNDPERMGGFAREVFILAFLFGTLTVGLASLWGSKPDE